MIFLLVVMVLAQWIPESVDSASGFDSIPLLPIFEW